MDFSIITLEIFQYLLKGAGLSLLIAAISVVIGVILGTLGAAAKLSHSKLANFIASVYVEVLRGPPMMMQITFAFLALPALVTLVLGKPIRFNPLVTGIIAIGLNSGAYTTELIRSGINGVDKGQFEAADTLGLSYSQKMKLVILPQAFKKILPPLVSEFITLIKETAIVGYVSLADLTRVANQVASRTYDAFMPLIGAAVIYFVIIKLLSILLGKLERRMRKSDNR